MVSSSKKENKKNNKKIVVISSIVGIVLAVGGALFYFSGNEDSSDLSLGNSKQKTSTKELDYTGKGKVNEKAGEKFDEQQKRKGEETETGGQHITAVSPNAKFTMIS